MARRIPIKATVVALVLQAACVVAATAQTGATQEAAAPEEAPGTAAPSGGMSLTLVGQRSYAPGLDDSQFGFRTDLFGTVPLNPWGAMEHQLYAHVRMGRGAGLSSLPNFAKTNASAFSTGTGEWMGVLAQAWYQASFALPHTLTGPDAKRTLEVTFGKMDPFVFFDQNAVAGDETLQFLNLAFVHNPMLDAGGDIGVDATGFAPGLRVALFNASDALNSWRLSLGLFGPNNTSTPMVMLQAEMAHDFFSGFPGNYRVYLWNNPQALHFDPEFSGPQGHSGWGFSMDQRVTQGVTVFGRYGQQSVGQVRFDRALTLGSELGGAMWGRVEDSLGVGMGWLRTSDAYRDFAAASGAGSVGAMERITEVYYRFKLGKQFELTPSFQWIANPGGSLGNPDVRVLGIRSQFVY